MQLQPRFTLGDSMIEEEVSPPSTPTLCSIVARWVSDSVCGSVRDSMRDSVRDSMRDSVCDSMRDRCVMMMNLPVARGVQVQGGVQLQVQGWCLQKVQVVGAVQQGVGAGHAGCRSSRGAGAEGCMECRCSRVQLQVLQAQQVQGLRLKALKA